MTDMNPPLHSPSPEFKDYLARDIARSLRHDARFAKRPRSSVARRLGVITVSCIGAVVALAVGLAFGNRTGYASARVENAQRRNALASRSMDVASQLAALRLGISRARENLVRAGGPNGNASPVAVRAAELDLGALEVTAARLESDMAQSETAVAPLSSGNIPMKRALSLACTAIAMAAPGESTGSTSGKQQGVPIIDLPVAPVKSASTFGIVVGLREVSGGRVLVNDGRRRQLKLLDSTLATLSVVFDSVPGTATSYGIRPIPLLRYLGDSSLTVDFDAGTLLMLGPTGQITRAVASPYAQSVPPYASLTTALRDRYSGVDDKGRILFNGFPEMVRPGMTNEQRVATMAKDSVAIMRADLESRRVDTVAFMRQGGQTALMGRVSPTSPVRFSRMPVDMVDVWGVLSDGTIGIVRGHDYHIDWILPDGTRRSTGKLPFDWKRLTDEDKQRLIDSVRDEASQKLGAALAQGQPPVPPPDGPGGGSPGARVYVPPEQRGPARPPLPMEYVAPALKDMPDYYPSVRIGAAVADMDGNLWILPNSTAQSKNGELVYDVVNPRGDFHRVRLPIGRSILGFGKGGVVYLASGDRTDGFILERARLPHPGQSQYTPPSRPAIPVVALPAAMARTPATLGLVSGVHQMADGKVLVNDAFHRQLKLFEPSLQTSTLVADSTSGNSNSYGPAPVALIPYRGDSSLFPDLNTQSLLVLDGGGQVVRALALTNPRDFPSLVVGFSRVDAKGRLLYRSPLVAQPPSDPGLPPTFIPGDSAAIVRVDLDLRRVDTLGRIKVRDGTRQTTDRTDPAHPRVTITLNPLPALDEWSMLSDGSVAFVRAHDYHIDWVRPDGSRMSSPRLPFDWRRLTDADKQDLVDSARTAQNALMAALNASQIAGGGTGGRGGSAADEKLRTATGVDPGLPAARPIVETVFVPLKDITDFYPPLRRGATIPDLDGNLWILPTTSAQSLSGELVYDVVNNNGELFERVRLPAGRSLVGFGKGGVVYLLVGDRTNGFSLERTRLGGR